MFIPSLITLLAFSFLILKLSPKTREKLLGYDLAFDITVTVGLMLLFGSSTISGLMTAITTGFMFSIAIYIIKHLGHYQVLERKGLKFKWVRYNGKWRTSCTSVARRCRQFISRVESI